MGDHLGQYRTNKNVKKRTARKETTRFKEVEVRNCFSLFSLQCLGKTSFSNCLMVTLPARVFDPLCAAVLYLSRSPSYCLCPITRRKSAHVPPPQESKNSGRLECCTTWGKQFMTPSQRKGKIRTWSSLIGVGGRFFWPKLI